VRHRAHAAETLLGNWAAAAFFIGALRHGKVALAPLAVPLGPELLAHDDAHFGGRIARDVAAVARNLAHQ